MRDQDALADLVVLTVKSALTPVLERLASAEQQNRELQARVVELSGLRDRLVVVETKAVLAAPAAIEPPNLTPLLERMAGTEARVGELRERVAIVETRAPQPAPAVLEATNGPSAADLELSIRDRMEPLTKQVAALSERIAVAEVRQPVPGPQGPAGRDGVNGKDGSDGLGFEDMVADFDPERKVLTLKFERGTLRKSFELALPFMRQQGVYAEGKSYTEGDVVTWGGSQWHCNEETSTKPGDGSKAWTLIVKRGRDGKDGRDAVGVPVVSVGRA